MAATGFVSVIVPVFDNTQGLRSCLSALRGQSYPADAYEVVVVDNGSNEDLRPVVAAFPGFRLEREDRPGSYAARNRGITASKGQILAFTDSDCIPDREWIEAGVESLQRLPDGGAVGGRIEMVPRDPGRITLFDLHDLVWGMPQKVYVRRFGLAATANLFAHRSVFDQIGSFDPAFKSCGDCEWSFRLGAAGITLGYADEARIRHPSRSTLAAFVRRRRRIAGGYYQLEPLLTTRYADREFEVPRGLRHSVNRVRRSLGHPRLQSTRRKLGFMFAELLLYAVTLVEGWRLRLGGRPTRS
jgi:glycosyltransferase involved in cell wall biosynthesis